MNKTQELQEKYGPKHILHPFRFYCLHCHFEYSCTYCIEYEHNFCSTCYKELSENTKRFYVGMQELRRKKET